MNLNNESNLHAESSRGQRAIELLENELLIEAFTVLDNRLTDALNDLPDGERDKVKNQLEQIWMMRKLLKSLKGHISDVITTGKMASLKLEQNRSMAQRFKESLENLY
jgi:hypothetical protein